MPMVATIVSLAGYVLPFLFVLSLVVFFHELGQKTIELVAIPRRQDVATSFGTARLAVIGAQCNANPENWHLQTYSLVDSVRLAGGESWFVVQRTGTYFKQQSTDQLSGPIRIAEVAGQMARAGLAALLNLAAVLSISVGLLNLLPIPLLDGGHLAYYAIEAMHGKAVNERAKQFGIDIGLFLLVAFMCFVTYNDVIHLIR